MRIGGFRSSLPTDGKSIRLTTGNSLNQHRTLSSLRRPLPSPFSPQTPASKPTSSPADAIDADGTLHGDIVIEGSGDPSISGRSWPYAGKTERPNPPLQALEGLADQIAKSGRVRRVTGTIIGDDSTFLFERYGSGWAWDDLQWEYGAPVSALSVNDNSVYLDLMPGAAPGDPVSASWNPPVPYYALENTAVTGAAGPKPQIGVDRQPGSKVVRLYGTLPDQQQRNASCAGHRRPSRIRGHRLPPDAPRSRNRHRRSPSHAPQLSCQHRRVSRCIANGGSSAAPEPKEASRTRSRRNESLLASYTSPPLGQDLTVINKVSQNLHVELILRDLGKAVLNDGSIAAGARVVRQFLDQRGSQSD